MTSAKIFLQALRLPFLTGSLLPVLAAAGLAHWQNHSLDSRLLLLTLLGVGALHLGGNLLNDYYDSFGSDPLNLYPSPFSGGSRVIQNQELSALTVRNLAYGFLLVGVACGLCLIYLGRLWVALVGALGLLAAYLYSASPVQLMSLGLGELTIFLAFGPVLSFGAYYVMTGDLKTVGLAIGLPLAFLITAILWINEFPDLPADVAAAKHHLVARLGLQTSRWLYAALMLAPFACLFFLVEICRLPAHLFACLVALPLALHALRAAWRTDPASPDFVAVQAQTIKTHFVLGLTQTLALFYAAFKS